jgi:DNA-binding LytR/AlgR family response regulator
MLNIVIFDDDPMQATLQRHKVEKVLPPDLDVAFFEVNDADALRDLVASGLAIDILLADVMMPEGAPSGIELVRELFPPSSGTQVIFVSGFLDQATEVYAADHLYFLLKPIDSDKLADALSRALAAIEKRRQRPTMLRIKTGRKERLINARTITYLESGLHRVTVHTLDGSYETYAKLDDLAAQLPRGFTRCHRSFLVNLAQVSALNNDSLTLRDGTEVPISRRRQLQTQRDLLLHLAGGKR